MSSKREKIYRLNFDLSLTAKARIEKLVDKTDASSNVEVLRRSLALMEMVLDHGGKVYVKQPDGSHAEIMIL